MMMKDTGCRLDRTTFLVDGLSLYHSTRCVNHFPPGVSARWLDIYSLLVSCLHDIGPYARLHEIYYFPAHATQLGVRNLQTMLDYRDYVRCLRASPICIETGGDLRARLLLLLQEDDIDTAVIVSTDRELAPALTEIRDMFPGKEICLVFPTREEDKVLSAAVGRSFHIRRKQYARHQLPDAVVLSHQQIIHKPGNW